jgi:hypothetical protein
MHFELRLYMLVSYIIVYMYEFVFKLFLKLTNLFLNFANKRDPEDLLPFVFLDSHFLILMSYLLIVSLKIGENYLLGIIIYVY